MGLDMSLFIRPRNNDYEIGDWRKFNALQNYMEVNFGEGEEINCKDIQLTEPDIGTLLVILKKVSADHSLAEKLFPNTTGFFYGSQDYDEYYFEEIDRSINLFEKALEELEDNEVFYNCWYQEVT